MKNIFKGLGIALVTPFCENGDVDYDALKCIVNYQIENGADFICMLATTGEVPTLTAEEKQQIKELVVSTVSGRVPILVGCGGNNTSAVCNELKTADFTGIDGILSICPYYNKPTQEGLFQHFKAISEASSLPIILYNVPARTGVNLAAETTCRLAFECDNIVCIKEASGNIEQIVKILHDKPEDFDVISGDDSLTLQIAKEGGVGVISVIGNAYTRLYSKLVRLAMEGKFAEAETIDNKLQEMYRLMFVDGNPAGIKALMGSMGLLRNVLRLPLVPVRNETHQQIADAMKIQESLTN